MNYKLLIGLRYTRAQPSEGAANRFISVIALISMLGLALGVAALIVVLSAMNAFRQELRELGKRGQARISHFIQSYLLRQPMIRPRALLGCLFIAGLSMGISAEELQCKDSSIVVHGSELESVQDGCKAVKTAARFFESFGLSLPSGITITMVDRQPTPLLGVHETANFDSRQKAIRVLAYQTAVKATEANDPGLGRIVDRDHWRSYIIHELTHAAIQAGCNNDCPSRAIHEYVAAVAQIAGLSMPRRSELLEFYPDLDPFRQLSEITEIYYAINPHYFAVKSYKHYLQLSDPRAFFRGLLQLSD